MSTALVSALKASFDHSHGMLTQFIDICPEDLWKEKKGGWPVWQQVYHALSAYDFFVLAPTEGPTQTMFPQGVASLSETPNTPPEKETLKKLAATMKAKADAYIASLNDDMLLQLNAGLSGRIKMDVPHIVTLGMMSSHVQYHLGSCDAALRDRGLKGVF